MILLVEINTENAAFGDSMPIARLECARILRTLAQQLEDNHNVPIPLYDVNGNRVGEADFVNP